MNPTEMFNLTGILKYTNDFRKSYITSVVYFQITHASWNIWILFTTLRPTALDFLIQCKFVEY